MPDQTDPHEILRTSPFTGSLEEALAAHPPRAKVPVLTAFLAVGVLAVGGLVAGIHADRTWGRESTEAGPGASTGRSGQGFPAGGGQGRFPGRGGGQGPGQGQAQPPGQQVPGGARPNSALVQGTITAVTGDSVTVKTSDGSTVTLKLGDQLRTAPSFAR
ncbi:myosin N-terminal SH3-like domain-containing protein [Streptomyces sp. NC-S4]